MTETLCDVNGILTQAKCAYSLSTSTLSRIGKKAADLYQSKHGTRPPKRSAKVYSKTYQVYSYPEDDRWMVYLSAAQVLVEECKGQATLRDRLRKLYEHCKEIPIAEQARQTTAGVCRR